MTISRILWIGLAGVSIGAHLILAWVAGAEPVPGKGGAAPPAQAKAKAKAKQTGAKGRKGPQKPKLEAIPFAGPKLELRRDGHQLDLPAFATGPKGAIFVLYIDHDGTADQLCLAAKKGDSLEEITGIGEKGILHDPALAVDNFGDVWCFWGRTSKEDVVTLQCCVVSKGRTPGAEFTLSRSTGSEAYPDAGRDPFGRIWVTWQSTRNQRPDIHVTSIDPGRGTWSDELRVSPHEEGDWEPKIAFDDSGQAWILYDGAEGNEFNLYLARVHHERGVDRTWPIAHSPRYEARAGICRDAEGKGFWIVAEQGKTRWALDARGHANATGINAQKSILFGRFDIASETFDSIPLGNAGKAGAPVNLPAVGLAPDGSPWVSYRYFERVLWRIAVTRYDPEAGTWSARRRIEGSTFGQDRTSHFLAGEDGKIWHGWTSDLRDTKASKEAGIYLAAFDPEIDLPAAVPGNVEPVAPRDAPFSPSQHTPEREFDDRHVWTVGGKKYGLYWGDLHRHTDVSNCRTGFDGCINEHFRYACDIGKLDFLGTSDHTDVGKIYSAYEWWHNQRMHDVFHVPGRFNSLFVYEREQRWPWGHRNVVFADRGGPVVYIQRNRYRDSIWQKDLPVKAGVGEITPPELWDVLKRSGKSVAIVSHTGATGMGTDWGRYDKIDYDVETLVEIFQGARVSYEGAGAPQPAAGHLPGEKYTVNGDAKEPPPPPAPIEDFGKYRAGLYQNALELGHRLGVFTSSDHISTHVSYGGVFCEKFDRHGIIEGFNARRTIAATDKIYLDFTCNGELLGSIFTTSRNPELWFRVDGTAPLKRVTIVRNEENWKVFDSIESRHFEQSVIDDSPLSGENRYYIRVEQADGNMAWSSPVWVTVKS